ncbi:MAG: DUF423 domain-containing protein [Rhodoblastus sp.]|nr:MAG: DUF423 domain-containing protein [Rhodoblastus sp.]
MSAARLILALCGLYGAAGVALMAAGAHAAGSNASVAGQMLTLHAGRHGGDAGAQSGYLAPGLSRLAIALLLAGVALFAATLTRLAFRARICSRWPRRSAERRRS